MKLDNFIIERNDKIKPKLFPDDDFKILGVNNKIGLFDAYIAKGSSIKQPYQIVNDGYLVYNPYRVNVGSIGLKTEKQKHDLISNAYVVFNCKNNLNSEFLYRLFLTDKFNQVIKESTSGSVRQNLTYNLLSNLDVPLPPIGIQNKLVDNYKILMKLANEKEAKSIELEQEIENYLLSELGIEIQKNRKQKGLMFVSFKEVSRWSFDYLKNISLIEKIINSKFKSIPFNDIITFSQYGLSEKSSIVNIGIPMLRMNNIGDGKLNLDKIKYIGEKPSISNYILEKNDFLINRTNSKELVGKATNFNLDGKYTFASYLIRYRIDSKIANIVYINELFNSKIIRFQIDIFSRQILGQANINSEEIKQLLIPLPPLKKQNEIVKKIEIMRTEIKEFKNSADENRKKAKYNFEKEIFK